MDLDLPPDAKTEIIRILLQHLTAQEVLAHPITPFLIHPEDLRHLRQQQAQLRRAETTRGDS